MLDNQIHGNNCKHFGRFIQKIKNKFFRQTEVVTIKKFCYRNLEKYTLTLYYQNEQRQKQMFKI